MGKFCDFISEKGRLQSTSEIYEKNKVQREKWPVPSNGPLYNIQKYFSKVLNKENVWDDIK